MTSIRRINLSAKDLIVDPNTQTIYASVPSSAGSVGNSLTAINPFTGAVGASVFIGSEPGRLAGSDDGQFIYVALDGAAAIRRFDVKTQAAGLQFPVGNAGFEGHLSVYDMAVMPGSAHTLAVARKLPSGSSPDTRDTAIYDDGVQRPQAEPGFQGSFSIKFSNSPSLLYGFAANGLHRMTVDSSGIAQLSSISGSVFGNFKVDNGLIYSTAGQVIDPGSGAVMGAYPDVSGFNSVIPESSVNRVYFLTGGGSSNDAVNETVLIRAFDQHTFQPSGSFTITGVNGFVNGFVRWGANGLAFGTTGGQVFLIQTSLIPSSEPVPTPTPIPTTTPTPTPVPTPAPGEFRQLSLPSKDLIVDPNTQTLFASNESDAGAFSNSITPIDPATGLIGNPVLVGGGGRMAISDDGQFIYVGLAAARAVSRFNVVTRTHDMQFNLNQDTSFTDPLSAQDIAVMPGNPGVVAVARANFGSSGLTSRGVAIYDNGVQRSAVARGGTAVEFSPSPSVLYSYNALDSDGGFRKMVVGSCGVAEAAVTYRITAGDIKYDNGRVYATTGQVIDPESGIPLGKFVGNEFGFFISAVATDSKAGRVYFLISEGSQSGPTPALRVFDMNTFLPVGELKLPGVLGRPISLVRWGAHGLAFNTFDGSSSTGTYRTYLLENAIVASPSETFIPAQPPPTPTLTVSGNVTYFDGLSGVQINVTGAFTASGITNPIGDFAVGGIPHCADIIVTPSKENYTFTPPSVRLTNPGGAQRLMFNATPKRVLFPSSLRNVAEGANVAQVVVRRDGDLSQAATVDYETAAGTASDRSDYTAISGSLRFEPNEATKTLNILITDDVLVEGLETFTLRLKNPSGAMLVPSFDVQTLRVNDDDTVQPTTNPLQDARFFVRRQYHDFLNRDPSNDPSGFDFWTGQITACDIETDPQREAECLSVRRINVSAAFYLSIEFQETGFLVERIYKTAFGDAIGSSTFGGAHTLAVPIVRLNEFLPDTQRIGQGVIIGQPGADALLEANKNAFSLEFVQRQRFTDAGNYPLSLTPAEVVDRMNARAGGVLTQAQRNQLVTQLTGAADVTAGRASVLRQVAENATLKNIEKNRGFVLMQYFGYLRRNPNDAPDTDYSGYDFWLQKLNQFNGNFVQAEMVKAFLTSLEYQRRFGPTNFDISH